MWYRTVIFIQESFQIVAIDIQQGTNRPYYIARKGLLISDQCVHTIKAASGVTLKDVMMGISVCWNVKLANIFYRLELIEAYGTRMSKIMGYFYKERGGKTLQLS